jgi:hypothetical protein
LKVDGYGCLKVDGYSHPARYNLGQPKATKESIP